MNDYLTLITAPGPVNKRVSVADDGTLTKEPAGQIVRATAQTVHVPDMAAFAEFYRALGSRTDQTMILGFIRGTEGGEPFTILSTKEMSQLTGILEADLRPGAYTIQGATCFTRTKGNFTPSSWLMFDYDRVKGMPTELETDDKDTWLRWMQDIVPGLDHAAIMIAPSTTSRVMLHGAPAFGAKGWHAFVQAVDADHRATFGANLLVAAMGTKYGFMRPLFDRKTGEPNGQHRPWTIFDPSVFGPERLVYDGSPVVTGKGLSVAAAELIIRDGDRLDTRGVIVDADTETAVKRRTGLKIERSRKGASVICSLHNTSAMRLDTVVETQAGMMTVAEYWDSGHGKLRCQSPFRSDSTSWAGFLNRHHDDVPFIFDTGTATKFTLSKADADGFRVTRALEWIEANDDEAVNRDWQQHAEGIGASGQETIRQAVHAKTGMSLRVLTKGLAEVKDAAKAEAKTNTRAAMILERVAAGRNVVAWDDDALPVVVRTAKQRLNDHQAPGLVLNYGGQLAAVRKTHPASVRQIQRKAMEGEGYPEQYLAAHFTPATLPVRILESMAFMYETKEGGYFGPCPSRVSQAILDDPSFAPPLAGILEVPSITPAGRVIDRPGYDPQSGFFATFDHAMTRIVPTTATRDDALRAAEFIRDVVFEGFPFGSETDAAAAVAMMLTAFMRRFLPSAPGFLISATTQASGKSTLAEIVFQSAYGRPAAASTWSDDQAEMSKHILGILAEGHSGVLFDNLPFGCRVDGDEVAKLLTAEVYSARLLGTNTTARLPTNVLVIVTGNQLAAIGDMTTRLLPIMLTPDAEDPARTRHARRDMGAWLERNRPEIVRAVLTIFVAWHQAKASVDVEPTRFPQWDDAIRRPMAWLGLPDCAEAFDANAEEDPIRAERGALLEAWHSVYGDQWIDLRDITEHWQDDEPAPDYRETADEYTAKNALRLALLDLFPEKKPTTKHIGLNFRYFKNAVIGGYRLEQLKSVTKSRKARPWRVVVWGVKGLKGVSPQPDEIQKPIIWRKPPSEIIVSQIYSRPGETPSNHLNPPNPENRNLCETCRRRSRTDKSCTVPSNAGVLVRHVCKDHALA